jgi:hypothetical protein
MCYKCEELDVCIAHYRKVASRVTEEQTLRSIGILIRSFEARNKLATPTRQGKTARPLASAGISESQKARVARLWDTGQSKTPNAAP